MTRHPRLHAFTLIELLVVISIIALLISILLPALGSARESAMTVSCQTNFRQTGLGIQTYAADHRANWPTTQTDGSYTFLLNALGGESNNGRYPSGLGLVYSGSYMPTLRAYYCPSRNPSAHASTDLNRAAPPAAAVDFRDNPSAFLSAAQAAGVQTTTTTSWRGKLWWKNNTAPVWGPALKGGERYLYHEEIRPAGAPHTLAVLADNFGWSASHASIFGDVMPPQGQFFHAERGYNVGYTDGHVEFIADPSRKIITFGYGTIGSAQSTYAMYPYTDMIWNAFDGNPVSYNGNHITGLR